MPKKLGALLCALVCLLATGCAAPGRAPTDERIRALKTVDVIIATPENNFTYGGTTMGVYSVPASGVAIGPAIGINVAANVALLGAQYLAQTTAREAEGPVGASVTDI